MARNSVTIQLILEGKDAKRSINALEREFGDLERAGVKSTKNIDKNTKRLSDTNARASKTLRNGLIAGYAALGFAAQQAVSRAIEKGSEFEQQLANLEAITGITSDRLDRLGDRALQLSTKYGVAASNIIEANKLVASQLAEKIDFGTEEGFDQLQQVSEQAIVLAQSAGIELSDAVQTTTSVINQFNLEASQSERVINTLAAGAKFGAAEVPAIGRALVNAGAAAAGASQSIETTNAAIQVLAANGQVGERAGTALRAIFTRLQTQSEDLAELGIGEVNVKANGLTETLKQLQPVVDNTTELSKIFGAEALNQVQILVRNADAVGDLTDKVSDTSIAYEQAEVRLNTYEGASNRLSSAIDNNLIKSFQTADGAGVKLLDTLTNLTISTGKFIDRINESSTRTNRLKNIASQLNAESEQFIDIVSDSDRINEILDNLINGTEDFKNQLRSGAALSNELYGELENLDQGSDLFEEIRSKADNYRFSLDLTERQTQQLVSETEEQIRSYQAQGKETGLLEEQLREYTERLNFVQEELQLAREASSEYSSSTDEVTFSLEDARASYEAFKNSLESPINLPDDSPLASGIDVGDTELSGGLEYAMIEGSVASLTSKLGELKQAQRGATSLEEWNEYQEKINDIESDIGLITGGIENASDKTQALLGFSNLVGNAFLQAAIHGRELDDVLKGIIQQLASKAFILGLGTLITGGVPGGGTFLSTLFSGFAGGVTNYQGGTALVGEEGPELVNLPRGSNVITNENTQRLIDSANRIASSPSQMATNVANTSVQNISQRVDMGGVSKEVGQAVSQAMSGARIVVGSTGELMVQFREESRRQKDLGGDSYIPFNDI